MEDSEALLDPFTQWGDGYHHLRGHHRIGGLLDVGTQCALVELPSGECVFLGSYTLSPAARSQAALITNGGTRLSAILNLHPYHTKHVEELHRDFPDAKLYGTARHRRMFPFLPWEDGVCDAGALKDRFPGLRFATPAGVDLVCENENVHFGSTLVFHEASGTVHVDDTLSRVDLPFPLSTLPMNGRLDFHPSLAGALRHEPGAADAFREWAIQLGIDWADAERIAMAHNTMMRLVPGEFPVAIGAALGRVKYTLQRHRQRFG